MPQAMTRPNIPDMRPDIEPQQAFRGFTNVPGYAFQGEGITTEYVPEDYGTNPNAQLVGGQDPGVAPVLPQEEYAKFEKRKQQESPISVNDIARMNPKEAAAAIEKQLGPRPTLADAKPALYKQAMTKFHDYYIANEGRLPSAQAWAKFDEQWNKDPKVAATVKAMQGEWDNTYKKLEKQATDTREIKKVVDGRYKDAHTEAGKRIALLSPEDQKVQKPRFLKALHAAITGDPANMEENIAEALDDIPGTKKGVDRIRLRAIADVQKDIRFIGAPEGQEQEVFNELLAEYENLYRTQESQADTGTNDDKNIADILRSNGYDPTPENIATFRENNAL